MPADCLYDVLVNGLLNGLDDVSLNGLETLVESTEQEVERFLENPSPPSLYAAELKREVGVLLEDLYRLSADAAHSKEPRWDEWTFLLEQIADSLTTWLRKVWLCVWEYRFDSHFDKPPDTELSFQDIVRTGSRLFDDYSRLP